MYHEISHITPVVRQPQPNLTIGQPTGNPHKIEDLEFDNSTSDEMQDSIHRHRSHDTAPEDEISEEPGQHALTNCL